MSVLTAKTFDEHLDYLLESVRLMLWFLPGWLAAHPEEGFVDALRGRVDIYRKTEVNPAGINPQTLHWDDPRWAAMEAAAALCFADQRAPAAFAAAAFPIFEASVRARAPRDFADDSRLDGYTYGSIRFDPPAPGERRVSIHIANARQPASLFADPAYLPACLRETMRRAAEYGADELGTFTWLNEHPAWLALFPACWQARMSAPNEDIQWHYGYWGQFINARGGFNHKLAAHFRATGRMPYLPRYSWCTFAELGYPA